MVTACGLDGGADLGGSLDCSQAQQLLDLVDAGEAGEAGFAGADVEVNDALEAVEVLEVILLPSRNDLVLVPVGNGLISTGERVLRKSTYAVGGVMGVLRASSRSRLMNVGVMAERAEVTIGLASSDG